MKQNLHPRKEKMQWRHLSTKLCTPPVTGQPHFTWFHLCLPLLITGTWEPWELHHLFVTGTALSYPPCWWWSSLTGPFPILLDGGGPPFQGPTSIPAMLLQPMERPDLQTKWGQVISATGKGSWECYPIHITNKPDWVFAKKGLNLMKLAGFVCSLFCCCCFFVFGKWCREKLKCCCWSLLCPQTLFPVFCLFCGSFFS